MSNPEQPHYINKFFLTRSQFKDINDFFLSIDSPNITKKAGSLMEILCACLMGSECCMTMCDLSWKITCSVALVVAAVLRSSSDPTLPLSHPRLLQLIALSRSWSWQERETKMKQTTGCCCWILKQDLRSLHIEFWNCHLKFSHVKKYIRPYVVSITFTHCLRNFRPS